MPEEFLTEIEDDMDFSEVGRTGCLEPTGDAVVGIEDDEEEDD